MCLEDFHDLFQVIDTARLNCAAGYFRATLELVRDTEFITSATEPQKLRDMLRVFANILNFLRGFDVLFLGPKISVIASV